jgi:alanine dehydrogenase
MSTTTVGIPKEIKLKENRVSMTPDGVQELVNCGIRVVVEKDAGTNSSISDDAYVAAGATILEKASDVWSEADIVIKVKEPQSEEFAFFRPGLVLFTYLHLAAYPVVAKALLEHGVTGIAYETVQTGSGYLPLLAPMSEVAGRMSVQIGANLLERHNGGRGVLLGGVSGVQPASVVVLGGGSVGWNAAWMASGLEAEVLLLDKDLERLKTIDERQRGRITTIASNHGTVARAVAEADLVIGAVLVAGGRAPKVVTEDMVRTMKKNAVIIDIAIDQGGCVETSRETTHIDPTFEVHDVLHYAVGNMPGAVPHTSTYALTNATLPYIRALATSGVKDALQDDPEFFAGLNTYDGVIVNDSVAEALPEFAAQPAGELSLC